MTSRLTALYPFILLLLVLAAPARAEWNSQGVTAADLFYTASTVRSDSDGRGGIVVVWDVEDFIVTGWDIGIQRIDSEGNRLWGNTGVVVSNAAGDQYLPEVSVDAAGNAFVTWFDQNAPASVWVQKVDANGTLLWSSGVVVSNTGGTARVLADGAGGCFVVWQDNRFGDLDVVVQRFDAAGGELWIPGGSIVTNLGLDQRDPRMIPDGSGGIILGWEDFRSNSTWDVYGQRLKADGSRVWTANGLAIASGANDQDDVVIATDGADGAIFVYEDGDNIGANRVTASGGLPWPFAILLSNAPDIQDDPQVISDGAGGAIAVWNDNRNNPDRDVYAMRVAGNGSMLWNFQGNAVCTNSSNQTDPTIATDGAGGAIITWSDARNLDIYAQRMDASGLVLWGSSGIAVVNATSTQSNLNVSAVGNGSVILTGLDYRTPSRKPIAQRVDGRHGYWGRPEPIISSIADTPGDQGGYVSVNWLASQRDEPAQNLISHYSIWRAVDAVPSAVAGVESKIVTLAEVSPGFKGPAFRVEKSAAGEYFWEYVGEQDALYASGYSYNAATRSDSIGGDPAQHYYQVVAHTSSSYYHWPSAPDSGYSVDNLAPTAPLMLAAQRIGGNDVLLEWSPGAIEGDLSDYAVYRATASGVIPDPLFYLSDSADTTSVDSTALAASDFYYIVTARDVHGNESDPSNEAMVMGSPTGIGEQTPALTTLQVLPNTPNPFSAGTTLRVGVPEASDVTLEVYDVRGRRVYQHDAGRMSQGWQTFSFEGRDASGARLPSGVYFYRVRAAGFVETRKMVISR